MFTSTRIATFAPYFGGHTLNQEGLHALLLISCSLDDIPLTRSFKVLNFQAKHDTFHDLVRQNWITYVQGNSSPFITN